jgi:hypothetical protein
MGKHANRVEPCKGAGLLAMEPEVLQGLTGFNIRVFGTNWYGFSLGSEGRPVAGLSVPCSLLGGGDEMPDGECGDARVSFEFSEIEFRGDDGGGFFSVELLAYRDLDLWKVHAALR